MAPLTKPRKIRRYQEETAETVRRLGRQLMNKDLTLNQPDILDIIEVGVDLAEYHIAHPIQFFTQPGGSFEEAAGNWVLRWRLLVRAATMARDPKQTWYAKIKDDVSDEDWDTLFALYLRNEEIRLNNEPKTPKHYPHIRHPVINLEEWLLT